MTDREAADIAAIVTFLLMTGLITAIAASVTYRMGRYRYKRQSPPILLFRDAVTFSGLSFTVLMVMVARVLELPSQYTRTVAWIVGSTLPAIIGLGVFLYFEWFVIKFDLEDDLDAGATMDVHEHDYEHERRPDAHG